LAEGCIKDYERLLKTLADISAWLEAISVEATAFSDSPMVTKSLVALYVHIIGFWMKAYNVFSSSKSRKLFGAFKAIWTDYDDEFKTLKQSMDKDFKRFLVSANAEHHRQFSQFNQCRLKPFPGADIELIIISGPRKPSSNRAQRCRSMACSWRRCDSRHRFLPDRID
jgi:hypothetical protein